MATARDPLEPILAKVRDEHGILRDALDSLPECDGRAALELFFRIYSPL